MANMIAIDTNYEYILLSADFTSTLNEESCDKLDKYYADGFYKLDMVSDGKQTHKFFGESDADSSTRVFEALGKLDSRIADKPSALMKTFFVRPDDHELFGPAKIIDTCNRAWNTSCPGSWVKYYPNPEEYVAEMEDENGTKIRVLVYII